MPPLERSKQSVKDRTYRLRLKAGLPPILSEGDSWYAYPIYRNIIDYIDDTELYAIKRVEQNGDTLRNIINTGEFFPLIHSEEPKVLVFDGGGNDLVDPGFVGRLFRPPQAGGTAADMIDRANCWEPKLAEFDSEYERLFTMVDQRCPILVHGYDYLVPSPAGVRYDGINVTGPWVQKAMVAQGITGEADQRAVARIIIDDFNVTLQAFANRHPGAVQYLDLRGTLQIDEWANEMHPRAGGFEKLSHPFIDALARLIP